MQKNAACTKVSGLEKPFLSPSIPSKNENNEKDAKLVFPKLLSVTATISHKNTFVTVAHSVCDFHTSSIEIHKKEYTKKSGFVLYI